AAVALVKSPPPLPAPPPGTKTVPATKTAPSPVLPAGPTLTQTVAQAGFVFPSSNVPVHILPTTPIPDGLAFDDNVLAQGDAARGAALVGNFASPAGCIGCHSITGVPGMVSTIGPNLTHVGSRYTIAAGLFPNDSRHLA